MELPKTSICGFMMEPHELMCGQSHVVVVMLFVENLIGKGGYAEVYKGRLHDGRIVAIKRLIKGTTEEKTTDFLGELGIMAHVNHPNTTKLIGYGAEGGMHLVLEYSELGSLSSHLHG